MQLVSLLGSAFNVLPFVASFATTAILLESKSITAAEAAFTF